MGKKFQNILNIKSIFSILGVVLVFFGIFYLQSRNRALKEGQNYPKEGSGWLKTDDRPATQSLTSKTTDTVSSQKNENFEPVSIPAKKILNVPFASQAPFGNWSEPYESGCEEASIIMVEHYLQNQALSKDQMKSEIDAAVAWQIRNWGGHNDLNAEATLKLARDYFKLNGQVISNPTVDQIKKLIAGGQPVIVPTAGRLLGNPNFNGAGPEYHMLVIVGYDDAEGIFITNDPGIRQGERYIYKYDTIIHSISGPKVDMEKKVLVLGS